MESLGLVQRVQSYGDFTDSDSELQEPKHSRSDAMRRINSLPDMDPDLEKNKNISWVRGQTLILFYVGVLVFARLLLFLFGIGPNIAWTVMNLGHSLISFPFLHWVKGVPFSGLESNQGMYERFTFWEQLDTGAQFTRTKKILTIIPIVLYLLAITFSDLTGVLFTLNSAALLLAIIGKFPAMHRVRIFGINR